jgi:hypothetical protein
MKISRSALLAAVILAVLASVALADEPGGAAVAAKPVGYFETHYILTEFIVLGILAAMFVFVGLSGFAVATVPTKHYDNWGTPTGKSYTDIYYQGARSSLREVGNVLFILGVIYLILRLTCLSGLLPIIYAGIGGCMDIFFKG